VGNSITDITALLSDVADACEAADRQDLAERMRLAVTRVTRPGAVAAVIGEFKQGKSALINALVGTDVCPVDDDMATSALTILYSADEPVARVRRSVDGEAEIENVAADDLGHWVTEASEQTIDNVEVGIPSPLLAGGLSLVDTPGVGGTQVRAAGALMSFLPIADALLFVTDATSELTAAEAEFLTEAVDACPQVVVCVTKTDLQPDWRRMVEIDRSHLAATAAAVEVAPVSAALAAAARSLEEPALLAESGIPSLRDHLTDNVVGVARSRSMTRAITEAGAAVAQLIGPIETEAAGLDDPAVAQANRDRLSEMEDRAQEVQRAAGRWNAALQDGFTDLRSDTDYEVRTLVRATIEWAEAEFEDIDPAKEWETFSADMLQRVEEGVAGVFDHIYRTSAAIAARTAETIEPDAVMPAVASGETIDPAALWSAKDRTPNVDVPGTTATALEVIRGSYGGILMLGMVANLAALPLLGPLSLGAGVVFGGKQIAEVRKRRLEQRRQEARRSVRGYLDAMQLELATSSRQAIQEVQRDLRGVFTDRVEELRAAGDAELKAMRRSAEADEATRRRRLPALRAQLEELRNLERRCRTFHTEDST
jgi:hypothetical protein